MESQLTQITYHVTISHTNERLNTTHKISRLQEKN